MRSSPAAAVLVGVALTALALPSGRTATAGEAPACPAGASCDWIVAVDGAARFRLATGEVAAFGDPGDVPLFGDWDCDGEASPGMYRPDDGFVYLRNSHTTGIADLAFYFGDPADVPLAGDFDGDGCDTVSLYRPAEGRVYVKDELRTGIADYSFLFGDPGDRPFTGDFDGDGVDTIGLHRASTGFVYFRNSNTRGVADHAFFFGDPGDQLLAGDWDGDGADTVAVYRPADRKLYVKNRNVAGVADHATTVPGAATVLTASAVPVARSNGGEPAPPIRAAFYYPWFPHAWDQGAPYPYTHYAPAAGLYDSSDPALIDRHLRWAGDAHLDAFISSWWGPGHRTDDALAAMLARSPASPNPALRYAVYYEEEGQSDPDPGAIAADLDYLAAGYFADPAYLRVDGRPVVFVWADPADGAAMAGRWAEAEARSGGGLHVVLKVFPGYRAVPDQPDSWHQYGPASAYDEQLPHSVTVSPGFWHAAEPAPRLARDLDRFAADVARMRASGAFWQLVTTWNEWGEGTAVEPAAEWGTAYVDVLGG